MTFKSNPAYDAPTDSLRTGEVNSADTWAVNVQSLIAAAQDFTVAWVDLGAEIPVWGRTHIGLFLDLDVNDSLDMRIKVLYKHTLAHANEYDGPVKVLSASDCKIEPIYYEFNTDVDQKIYLSIPLDGDVPFVQFQIQAGTAGATPGQVANAEYTLAWTGAGGGN